MGKWWGFILKWRFDRWEDDVRGTQPIARCGYYEYAVVEETFEMIVPRDQKAMLAGLEGSTKFHRKMEGAKIRAGRTL